jgi:hypothetical protein
MTVPENPNFADELRRRVTAPDGKDLDALTAQISAQVVSLVQENFARLMARDIMKVPDDTGLGYACGSPSFTCGSYSCTGAVSCSGAFNCTVTFAG